MRGYDNTIACPMIYPSTLLQCEPMSNDFTSKNSPIIIKLVGIFGKQHVDPVQMTILFKRSRTAASHMKSQWISLVTTTFTFVYSFNVFVTFRTDTQKIALQFCPASFTVSLHPYVIHNLFSAI